MSLSGPSVSKNKQCFGCGTSQNLYRIKKLVGFQQWGDSRSFLSNSLDPGPTLLFPSGVLRQARGSLTPNSRQSSCLSLAHWGL